MNFYIVVCVDCIFWRLIPCQLHLFQIFSPILCVALSFYLCLSCCVKTFKFNCVLFDVSHFDRLKKYLILELTCVSWIISGVLHLLICLLAICLSSLEKCSYRPLAHWFFFLWDCLFFFKVELYELFIYFGYYTLKGYINCEYFLSISMLHFYIVDGFICCVKDFMFILVFYFFPFMATPMAFGSSQARG